MFFISVFCQYIIGHWKYFTNSKSLRIFEVFLLWYNLISYKIIYLLLWWMCSQTWSLLKLCFCMQYILLANCGNGMDTHGCYAVPWEMCPISARLQTNPLTRQTAQLRFSRHVHLQLGITCYIKWKNCKMSVVERLKYLYISLSTSKFNAVTPRHIQRVTYSFNKLHFTVI